VVLTIGVDVGGSKIAAGVVDEDGNVLEEIRGETPVTSAEAVEDGVLRVVKDLRGRHEVRSVGVAVPGFVDEQRARVRFTPNLPMRDRPIRDALSSRIGLPVLVENDANAAAWGEYRFGGGRGVEDMVLITVGTGLGGGIVTGGRLLRGAWGAAAELGHVRVVPDGDPCGCGKRGCWEQYASGSALGKVGRRVAAADPQAYGWLIEMAGGDPAAVSGRMVSAAARQGNLMAVELIAELGQWLGAGIADVADVLDPAIAVIGGGMSEVGDLLLEPARKAFHQHLSAGAYRPHLQIVGAELGNTAGLIGAGDLARNP
jgi:glucokinase